MNILPCEEGKKKKKIFSVFFYVEEFKMAAAISACGHVERTLIGMHTRH